MKYLCVYKPSKPEGTPPSQEEVARMGELIQGSMQSGALIATEGCMPSALGARVRLKDGKFTVTDGPFMETRELIGGFALMRADSKEEIIEHVRRFLLVAGDGETEIRQVYEGPDCGAPRVAE